jgi:lipoyl(octanoyl) transferase
MQVLDLGRIAYDAAWARQRETVDRRARGEIPDTLLLCEHPHVVTIGRGVRGGGEGASTLPGPEGCPVPVVRIERGGLATYHGPGQLVAYPIVRLDRARLGLDGFLRGLEEAVIRTAADFGVAACRNPGATGVWVRADAPRPSGNGKPESENPKRDQGSLLKLASIGVAVRRWVTYHGLALNVAPDLRYFHLIRPCGFEPGIMTSLAAQRGGPVDLGLAKERLASHLAEVLEGKG